MPRQGKRMIVKDPCQVLQHGILILIRQERIDSVNIGRRAIAADRPHAGRQLDRRLQMDTVIKASASGSHLHTA